MLKREMRGWEDGSKGMGRDVLSETREWGSGKPSTPRVRACAEQRSAAAR